MVLGFGVSSVPQCPQCPRSGSAAPPRRCVRLWSRSTALAHFACLLFFGHRKAAGRVNLEGALHGGNLIVLISG